MNNQDNNQILRNNFINSWSSYMKKNPIKWKKEHTIFINSQIIQSRNFYDRLLRLKTGPDKIIRKFNITNETIIKRLKNKYKTKINVSLITRET